jgi:hypothetical protein
LTVAAVQIGICHANGATRAAHSNVVCAPPPQLKGQFACIAMQLGNWLVRMPLVGCASATQVLALFIGARPAAANSNQSQFRRSLLTFATFTCARAFCRRRRHTAMILLQRLPNSHNV